MNLKPHYPVTVAGWAYLLGALTLLTLGGWVQDMDFKAGMLITEYGLVLLPVLLIGWFFRVDMKGALRLNPLKSMEMLLIPLMVLLALPVTLFLNLLVITLMAQFGKAYGMPIPSADSLADLSMLFFIISISAGICEEFFFRGMILDAYSARLGAKRGILVSAVLFGLFHFNPQNLLGPIFLGLLFGYLVLITKSLLAGILAHMTNNGIAVLMMYAANSAQKGALSQGSNMDMINQNPGQMVLALGVLGVVALGSALAVFSLLTVIADGRKLPAIAPQAQEKPADSEMEQNGPTELMAGGSFKLAEVIPLAIPAVIYTAVSYYLLVLKT